MSMNMLFMVSILLYMLSIVEGLIFPSELPPTLKQCFEMKTKYSDVKEVPSEDICLTCITDYLWKEGKHADCGAYNRTENGDKWIADMMTDLYPPENSRRYKRGFNRLRRKEYRMLTDEERNNFHLAINKMKNDTSVWPNRYDAFVEFHAREAGKSAHRGPNFFGWHRILLLLFEHQLSKQMPELPGIALPYWDSTLDSAMSIDPVNSVIWSDHFFGNGDGEVVSGPFKYWKSTWNNTEYKLVRNIGSTGKLFTKRSVINILSKMYTSEICEPSYYPMSSLEGLHDRVHFWVGGNMFNLETSTMDPVFYLHHCMVDLIWDIFRKQQRRYGIDPSRDYPYSGDPSHDPDRPMDGIPPIPGRGRFKNKDGFLSIWTDRYYFYDPPPTCNKRTLDCRSKFLECDPQTLMCVSKTKQATSIQYPTLTSYNNKKSFWEKWRRKGRGKRDISGLVIDENNFPFSSPFSYEKIKLSVPNEVMLGSPIQNTFTINCDRPDVNSWGFMAVKVVHIRPREVKVSAHVIENGILTDSDLYNETSYKSLRTHIKPGSPGTYSNCIEDQSGAFRIGLTSFGLSYNGWFEDYVVVDNRLPITSQIGYVAFKKPCKYSGEAVTSFITATDTCGRMCKPRCLQKVSESRYAYVPCTGVIQATHQHPMMFGESFGDAVHDIWDFSDPLIPQGNENNIFMVFYCDYSDLWPWDSCNKNKK